MFIGLGLFIFGLVNIPILEGVGPSDYMYWFWILGCRKYLPQ